ncbi:hypothetical protein NQ166_13155 [Microbacterium sp. zg.Y1090]|uniref:hypothetical protein n=1 Tax=Microbacterium TaxID=33882 RepID=UPI00214AD34D|nr:MULTISPECIES: hypothetical protein [unclassified Microbacterium]MCR2813711.1 hypothetical protein [Microbacterium sp. zg.Y1084]MCR2819775.1 hypothetical protein [Microbacterium sp. zg.Y1090]MDL5488245.1 hypothetical protein [Microbacterium sp. zg-Y1211]WIM27986.1 hypothetical protein QNO26_12675 [Microbacterium sp. zg-Y1090]
MPVVFPDALVSAFVTISLFLALAAALALIVVNLRRPRNTTLAVAGGIVVLCLLVVAVLPWNAPGLLGLIVALPAVALAVLGGDPVVRRVLAIATHGTVREGVAGGILVSARADAGDDPGSMQEILRGGTTIGYLERLGVVLGIIAGFPEAIAVVVALKGIGRFSELATPAARERFIVGTLASLLWACVVGAIVRLAIT